jgi:hypothetical protein
MTFFDQSNRIKIVTIYKNFFSNHDFFLYNFFKSVANRKEPGPELEPKPQLVFSAPDPGGGEAI